MTTYDYPLPLVQFLYVEPGSLSCQYLSDLLDPVEGGREGGRGGGEGREGGERGRDGGGK
jgi:hypothetical protein